MREVFLVCEGEDGKLDQQVLDLLVVNANSLQSKITPAGSNSSLDSLRRFLEQETPRGKSPSSNVPRIGFTVTDRDFRRLADSDATWADPNCRRLIWRRHEIENYLIDPTVVHTWFENLRRNPPAGISFQLLPATLPDVDLLISGLAKTTLEHHIGQLVFAEMQRSYWAYTDKTLIARPQRSGSVPLNPKRSPAPTRSDWLNALNAEWTRIERNRHATGRIPNWSAFQIRRRYDYLWQQLGNAAYFAQKSYLLDFEGKGLIWALGDYLRRTCRFPLSVEKLESELLSVLSTAYTTYNPYQPDEFFDLAQRMLQASM